MEINFDGIVGPTHTYGGLSYGNIASVSHKTSKSSPRKAVLQGLQKMKSIADFGLLQGLLPPQERPDLEIAKCLGFTGTDAQILDRAWKTSPEVLISLCSASAMWTANAATIAPSADSEDQKVHFTAANLMNKFHRSIEAKTTTRLLQKIFSDSRFFAHHEALPSGGAVFSDEGAANHTRLCQTHGGPGVHFFVFGKSVFESSAYPEPKTFPARQTLEASKAIARLHRLDAEAVVFAQQNPAAIDAGAFHNDVVAVGNQNVLFFHQEAFAATHPILDELNRKLQKRSGVGLIPIEVKATQVSLLDAIRSYLFNSQLLTKPNGDMILIAPHECQATPSVAAYLKELIESKTTPIREAHFFDLKQSMQNGGGPACLRLRVTLTDQEQSHAHAGVFLSNDLYLKLCNWGSRHYREELTTDDLRDPALLMESRNALDDLTQILNLGSVYSFQN